MSQIKKAFLILVSIFVLIGTTVAYAQKGRTKKKVVYRSFTQLDFSGETVQGKIRAPEVFYIFQRKRSEAHKITDVPSNFNHHRYSTYLKIKGAVQ